MRAVELLSARSSVAVLHVLHVLHVLREGLRRPLDLRRMIGGISAKGVQDALRRLERQGLVAHERIADAPPRVDYRLTPLGLSLLGPVDVLARWTARHSDELDTPS